MQITPRAFEPHSQCIRLEPTANWKLSFISEFAKSANWKRILLSNHACSNTFQFAGISVLYCTVKWEISVCLHTFDFYIYRYFLALAYQIYYWLLTILKIFRLVTVQQAARTVDERRSVGLADDQTDEIDCANSVNFTADVVDVG